MEKVVFVKADYLRDLNRYLEQGWKVKFITPVAQVVANHTSEGEFGAYIVLTDAV